MVSKKKLKRENEKRREYLVSRVDRYRYEKYVNNE